MDILPEITEVHYNEFTDVNFKNSVDDPVIFKRKVRESISRGGGQLIREAGGILKRRKGGGKYVKEAGGILFW